MNPKLETYVSRVNERLSRYEKLIKKLRTQLLMTDFALDLELRVEELKEKLVDLQVAGEDAWDVITFRINLMLDSLEQRVATVKV